MPSDALPPRLILYDGLCGLCDRSVQWILDHDPQGVISFAPLQGPTAGALRDQHPEIPQELSSMVLVRTEGGSRQILLRSRAVFAVLAELGGPWAALSWLRVLPAALTDLGYRVVAALRYRIWGRLDACRLPQPNERARFLE